MFVKIRVKYELNINKIRTKFTEKIWARFEKEKIL